MTNSTTDITILDDEWLRRFGRQKGAALTNINGSTRFVLLTERDRDALCQTVRALRAEKKCGDASGKPSVGGCGESVSTHEGFRCVDCLAWFHRDCANEHFTLDAYVKKLRELREQGAIDDWKKELSTLQSQLEQVTKERDEARSEMMRICTHPNTYRLGAATRHCHDCGLEIKL